MRLYSKTDLERCARLAVHLRDDPLEPREERDPEWAISRAVQAITNDTPEVYTRTQLEAVASEAALLTLQGKAPMDAVRSAVTRA